jgi:hypothetical protein
MIAKRAGSFFQRLLTFRPAEDGCQGVHSETQQTVDEQSLAQSNPVR